MAYTFDGNNKLIILSSGTTAFDVKDCYSRWKEWVIIGNNSKFLSAFFVIGGDALPGNKFLGTTYFLENSWKIRPFEGNHTLSVSGNLYSRDGSDPFVSTIGTYNVRIMLTVSNLIDTIATSGSSGGVSDWTSNEKDQIRYRLGIDGSVQTPFNQHHIEIDTNQIKSDIRTELAPELAQIMILQNGMGLSSNQATMLLEIYQLYGLDPTSPLIVSKNSRIAGNNITQTITSDSNQTTTVSRI